MEESRLDRAGSTILWEERAMDIETHLWNIEEFLREDPTIGHDDKILRLIAPK